MLVLAIDTSTPAVTAGVVQFDSESDAGAARAFATRQTVDARAHAEVLTLQIHE
ncbi:hypothetical protein [Rhodococcus xishaensis]|uniref:hypothetical protein n=1 Tax=Rhodococcus xishaensis TaxID=2487364 RepID=UPI001F354D7F|nr:hypothetical protein [Rhodococcus xishaensis]